MPPPNLSLVLSTSANPTEVDPRAAAVEKLVHHYLHAHHVRPDLDTLMWHDGHESCTHREIAERLWRENSAVPLPLIQVTLQELARRLRANEVERLRTQLLTETVPTRAIEELHAFVRLIARVGSDVERIDYYVTVFRQLIWQVKRKLRRLPSHWDLMAVLVGPQAGGKSTAVARFARPLGILYLADADFDVFTDNFRITALHRYYLVCLDEMGRAKHADLERVKQRITANSVQARAMRSEQERRLIRNASFVGTSNHPLSETVHDPTGMRRFAEVLCREDKWNEERARGLKALNFDLIWQVETGLDDVAPIYARRDLATRFQSETQSLSPFDYFVECCVRESGDELCPLRDIYTRYVAFEGLQARRPMAQQTFGKLMTARFGEGVRPGNVRHWRGLVLVD